LGTVLTFSEKKLGNLANAIIPHPPAHPCQVLADGPIIIEVLRTSLFGTYVEIIGNLPFSFFPSRAAGSRIIYIGKRQLQR